MEAITLLTCLIPVNYFQWETWRFQLKVFLQTRAKTITKSWILGKPKSLWWTTSGTGGHSCWLSSRELKRRGWSEEGEVHFRKGQSRLFWGVGCNQAARAWLLTCESPCCGPKPSRYVERRVEEIDIEHCSWIYIPFFLFKAKYFLKNLVCSS